MWFSCRSPDAIAKSDVETLQAIFAEEKLSKQVLAAAKRLSKKRSSTDASSSVSPTKRKMSSVDDDQTTPAAIEKSLQLPVADADADEDHISRTVLHTNRAPLVLAFAVMLLKHTMPEQPLSSRLSLAQAVVSVNSRSKAVSLGLESQRSADDEGWGQGQPVVRVMGRDIRVLKRWGYDWAESRQAGQDRVQEGHDEDVKSDETPSLWGLDVEALRNSNGPKSSDPSSTTPGLPIYTPQSARAYLLKSFASATETTDSAVATPKKKSFAAVSQEKERNLSFLLKALDLLYTSWAHALSKDELDRRAWQWYVHVRPEVESGVAGWGGRGPVKLVDILNLRRKG